MILDTFPAESTDWLHVYGPSVTSWLATYLVHSTVLLGGAWVAARFVRSPRRAEVLWRAALFGGFATAALQVALGATPLFGRVDVLRAEGTDAKADSAAAGDLALPLSGEALSLPDLGTLTAEELTALLAAAREPLPEDVATPAVAQADAPWLQVDLRRAGPVALCLGLLFAAGSLASGVWLLARRRRAQERLHGGALHAQLQRLTQDRSALARVELWRCARARSPHATGFLRPRIVVPYAALDALSPAEQRAMLAHELAHIERRDAVWLGITRAVQLLMPLQPLNGLARRRLGACAELLCDARAVERTGDRVALAQSLAKVASWLLREDTLPDAACAMASRRSLLGERVAHILDEDAHRASGVTPARFGAALALLGTAAAAPLVGPPHVGAIAASAGDVSAPMDEAVPFDAHGSPPASTPAHAAAEGVAASEAPLASAPTPGPAGPLVGATTLASESAAAGPSAPSAEGSAGTNTSASTPGPSAPRPAAAAVLAELGASLDSALAELDAEVASLRRSAAERALSRPLAARLAQLEQRASELRARAKRIRDLLVAAHPGGMEVPRGGRERAATPSAAPRAR